MKTACCFQTMSWESTANQTHLISLAFIANCSLKFTHQTAIVCRRLAVAASSPTPFSGDVGHFQMSMFVSRFLHCYCLLFIEKNKRERIDKSGKYKVKKKQRNISKYIEK
jgi:hypothetical protein